MEYQMFDPTAPMFNDPAWYSTLEMANHWCQPGHRERLMMTLVKCVDLMLREPLVYVADFGCGNGALLSELKRLFPTRNFHGYDLLPANVDYAWNTLGLKDDVWLFDFAENLNEARAGELVIMTEVLEHLVDPRGVLKWLHGQGVERIVASSPARETPEGFYPYHLWIWTDDSYPRMFESCGWNVAGVEEFAGAKFVIAGRI